MEYIRHETIVSPNMLERLLNAIVDELGVLRTLANETKADHNIMNAAAQGDFLLTAPGICIGSTKDLMANIAFHFIVNGKPYYDAADAVGVEPGTDLIPQSKYGCVAVDVGINGTLDPIGATLNTTGYTTALLAVAGLPAPAADHVRCGWVTVIKSDGGFTFGTTEFDAANVTAVFTDADSLYLNQLATIAAADSVQLIEKSK